MAEKSDYEKQVGNEYPDNWDAIRKQAYERDEYTCQNCGVGGGRNGDAELHAHHIVPLNAGGNNVLSNIKTVCHDCHARIHNHMSSESDVEEVTATTGSGSQSTVNEESGEWVECTGEIIYNTRRDPPLLENGSERMVVETDKTLNMYDYYTVRGWLDDGCVDTVSGFPVQGRIKAEEVEEAPDEKPDYEVEISGTVVGTDPIALENEFDTFRVETDTTLRLGEKVTIRGDMGDGLTLKAHKVLNEGMEDESPMSSDDKVGERVEFTGKVRRMGEFYTIYHYGVQEYKVRTTENLHIDDKVTVIGWNIKGYVDAEEVVVNERGENPPDLKRIEDE